MHQPSIKQSDAYQVKKITLSSQHSFRVHKEMVEFVCMHSHVTYKKKQLETRTNTR